MLSASHLPQGHHFYASRDIASRRSWPVRIVLHNKQTPRPASTPGNISLGADHLIWQMYNIPRQRFWVLITRAQSATTCQALFLLVHQYCMQQNGGRTRCDLVVLKPTDVVPIFFVFFSVDLKRERILNSSRSPRILSCERLSPRSHETGTYVANQESACPRSEHAYHVVATSTRLCLPRVAFVKRALRADSFCLEKWLDGFFTIRAGNLQKPDLSPHHLSVLPP